MKLISSVYSQVSSTYPLSSSNYNQENRRFLKIYAIKNERSIYYYRIEHNQHR